MKTIVMIFLLALCALLPAQRDEKFAAAAAMRNLLEIKMGELAIKNGYSENIRALAQQLVKDHTDANDELLEIALKKNMAFPIALGEREQEIYDKLVVKNAEEFDKTYTRLVMKDHRKNVCEHKKEAKRGKDPELKQYAATLVDLQKNGYNAARAARDQIKHKK